jgi:hypothetical protein
MALLELPHWLMIAGGLLVVAGLIGLWAIPKKGDQPDAVPDQAIETPPRRQMPPLPRRLASNTGPVKPGVGRPQALHSKSKREDKPMVREFDPIRLRPGLQERGFPAVIGDTDAAAKFVQDHIDGSNFRNHPWWQTAMAELGAYPSKQDAEMVRAQIVNALRQEGWLEE